MSSQGMQANPFHDFYELNTNEFRRSRPRETALKFPRIILLRIAIATQPFDCEVTEMLTNSLY